MKSQGWLIRFSNWLLSRIYDEEHHDEIEGDMLELHNERLTSKGKTKASLLYLRDAVLSVRNIGLKKKITKSNFLDLMLANSKFAFRIFLKDKFFASLNILGLGLGIAMSIIVILVLEYDFNYDKHYPNHERIYRLSTHFTATNIDQYTAKSARILPETLMDELPEIESITRVAPLGTRLLKIFAQGDEISSYEDGIIRTDSNYFKIFKHQFIARDEKSSLRAPFTTIITESTAKRYFGNEDPIGKTLAIGVPEQLFHVSAVIKDPPANTHLKFNIIMPGLDRFEPDQIPKDGIPSYLYWGGEVYTYMLMPENYNPQVFYDKWPLIYTRYFKPYGDQLDANSNYAPILQRLDQIHFYSKLDYDQPTGNILFTYVFATVGVFILLLACINYMNLSTAKSSKRASEISMKKVLGMDRRSLSAAFLTESVILSLISLLSGIIMVVILLDNDTFKTLLERDLAAILFSNPIYFVIALVIAIVIGLFSGIYPAIYLPGIPVISAIKGKFKTKNSAALFRKGLITVQFSVSMFVIICTICMIYQIQFLNQMNLGFKKENVIIIPIRGKQTQDRIPVIKAELLRNSGITHVSTSFSVVGTNTFIDGAMMAERDNIMEQQRVNIMTVGDDYFKTMDIEFKAGNEFSGQNFTDKYICNEATARLMGWGDNPVGKKVKSFGVKNEGVIVGMVKDFNYYSLHNAVQPLLIQKAQDEGGSFHVRVVGNKISETLEFLQKKWSIYDADRPFEYFFLDQRLDEYYKTDVIQQKLITWLSGICIFISFLGIIGLSAFTAEQRSKEIGIRRILGASVPRIIFMLSQEVLLLVILSALIIIPASEVVIARWLESFAYRISVNYLIHAEVIACALGAVFLVVFLQSFKVAASNPVDVLKNE